jgi:hypothetical protein
MEITSCAKPLVIAGRLYVEIVVCELPGWDEPLWAADERWLYLRRPEGIWKTLLPLEHLDKIALLYQRRTGSLGLLGGTQIGHNFDQKMRWHRGSQPVDPSDLDFPYGFAPDGTEMGPMLAEEAQGAEPGQVIMAAGPVFGAKPEHCWWSNDCVRARDNNVREILFPVAHGVDLEKFAKEGSLRLRFASWQAPWMEPFDVKVSC